MAKRRAALTPRNLWFEEGSNWEGVPKAKQVLKKEPMVRSCMVTTLTLRSSDKKGVPSLRRLRSAPR